jgi:hypothetical protein
MAIVLVKQTTSKLSQATRCNMLVQPCYIDCFVSTTQEAKRQLTDKIVEQADGDRCTSYTRDLVYIRQCVSWKGTAAEGLKEPHQ